jgi:hypothetical protein
MVELHGDLAGDKPETACHLIRAGTDVTVSRRSARLTNLNLFLSYHTVFTPYARIVAEMGDYQTSSMARDRQNLVSKRHPSTTVSLTRVIRLQSGL